MNVRTPKSAINTLYGCNSRVKKADRSSEPRENVLVMVADAKTGHTFETNMKPKFVEPARMVPRKLVPLASDEAQMYLQLLKLAGLN